MSNFDDLEAFEEDEDTQEDDSKGVLRLVNPTPAALEKITNDIHYRLSENQGEVLLVESRPVIVAPSVIATPLPASPAFSLLLCHARPLFYSIDTLNRI